jgi:hypothetical protein
LISPTRRRGEAVPTPARDLSPAEALDVLGLSTSDLVEGRIDLPADFVSGIRYEYCDANGCKPSTLRRLDPRFAVYLGRLALMLRDDFGATAIRHYGTWPAGKGQPSHDAGIAIDLSAVVTSSGTIKVYDDWGAKPKGGPGFRLQPGDRGHDLFVAIYQFTGAEGDDRHDGSTTSLGAEDSFIRHPDLRDAKAAALHKDHLHLQAGQIKSGVGVVPLPKPPTQQGPASPASPKMNAGSSSGAGGGIVVAALAALFVLKGSRR